MKYTITISQARIFTNGLITETDLVDWAIIDYLKDFALYKKSKKIRYQNEEYIWLNFKHLINSLPLLKIRSKMGITKRIRKLRTLGLIKTYQALDNTLYYTFTDRLIDCLYLRAPSSRNTHSTTPGNLSYAGPVNTNDTAQDKTNNTIINKDYYKKETSFLGSSSSSFTKPTIKTNQTNFKNMSVIWQVVANIRQRQLQNKKRSKI